MVPFSNSKTRGSAAALWALAVAVALPPLSGAEELPDLVAVAFDHDADYDPVAGDVLSFVVTVRNNGGAAAGPFSVRFALDGGIALGDVAAPGLAAGEDANVTSAPWAAAGGDHAAEATLDVLGEVAEADEANNVAGFDFHIVDLRFGVAVVTLRPEFVVLPLPGSSARYDVDVTNTGEFADTIELGAAAQPTFGWRHALDADRVALEAGASARVHLTVTHAFPSLNQAYRVDVVGTSVGEPGVHDAAPTLTHVGLA